MNDRLDIIITGLGIALAFAFAGTILFGLGSAFVAFGMWMLRFSGVIA